MGITQRITFVLFLTFGFVQAQRAPLQLYPKTELTAEQQIQLADLKSLYDTKQATEEQKDAFGQLLIQAQQYKKALEVYDSLCQTHPDRFEYQFRRGAAAGFVLDTVSKISALPYLASLKSGFEQAVRINPNSISAQRALMSVYVDLPKLLGGDLSKALQICADIESISSFEGALAHVWFASKTNKVDLAKKHMEWAINSTEKEITVNDSRYEFAVIAWMWGGDVALAIEYLRAFIHHSQPGDLYPAVFAQYRLAEISELSDKEAIKPFAKESIVKQFPKMESWLETFDPIASLIKSLP